MNIEPPDVQRHVTQQLLAMVLGGAITIGELKQALDDALAEVVRYEAENPDWRPVSQAQRAADFQALMHRQMNTVMANWQMSNTPGFGMNIPLSPPEERDDES